jgi:hypothetical protein
LVGWNVVVRSLRNPERFNIIVGLCLALAAGVSAADLLRRLSNRRASLIIAAICALVIMEYWAWPFPTRSPDVPAFYGQLAEESGDFAIVDLPITNDLSKRYMYYQTTHGKPTVTGHVSRPPEGAYNFIAANELLRAGWQGQPPEGDPEAALAALSEAGVRYLILHREWLSDEELAALISYLPDAPVFVDEQLLIYWVVAELQPKS